MSQQKLKAKYGQKASVWTRITQKLKASQIEQNNKKTHTTKKAH